MRQMEIIVFSIYLVPIFYEFVDAFSLGRLHTSKSTVPFGTIRRTVGARGEIGIGSDGGNDVSIGGNNSIDNNECFRMVFTCNRCETRNMVEITRKAWNSGIVIATCQGCNVKHLLADNMNLLRGPGDKKFMNVIEQLQSNVTILKTDDSMNNDVKQLALSEFDLTTDENGNIQLLPRSGDENIVSKERVSATGPKVDPSLIEEETKAQPKTAEIMGDKNTAARIDSYNNGGSFEIELPPESEVGDLLQLSLGNNEIMMLSIPQGIPSGAKVKVMGAIEFMLPKGKKEGDIITLKTPEGDKVIIQVPEGVTEGSFLKVAYPVILSDK